MRLQLRQLIGIFLGQEIRNCGKHLGHFHQWSFGITERSGERRCKLFIAAPAENPARTKLQRRAGKVRTHFCGPPEAR